MKIKELNSQLKRRPLWQIYSIITISAIMVAMCVQYTIIPAGIYSPGLGGISTGISYILTATEVIQQKSEAIVYWLIYIVINIPIIIFMWKMFGENFSIRTIYYLIINISVGIFISTVGNLNDLYLIPDLNLNDSIAVRTISILILSLFGGVIYGIGLGWTLSVGGSTAGVDPISRFLSRNRGMDIAKILFVMSITISLTFITILFFIETEEMSFTAFIQGTLMSPEMIGTLIFASSHSIIASKIYSTTRKKKITVTSQKSDEISDHFNDINYHRAHSITKMKGGFSKETYYSIQMVLNSEELHDVVEDIAKIDSKAFIVVDEVSRIYDVHDWRANTKDDKNVVDKKNHKKNKKNIKKAD